METYDDRSKRLSSRFYFLVIIEGSIKRFRTHFIKREILFGPHGIRNQKSRMKIERKY